MTAAATKTVRHGVMDTTSVVGRGLSGVSNEPEARTHGPRWLAPGGRSAPKTFLLAVMFWFLVAAPADARTPTDYLTETEALAAAFPSAKSFRRVEFPVGGEVRGEVLARTRLRTLPRSIFEATSENGTVLGWAVERDVIGKSEPITYLVAVDENRSVRSVEILAYRESHGGEVRRDAFRKQFIGKTASSELTLNRSVRNISGATVSCRAITDGVHDDLLILESVVNQGAAAGVSPEGAPLAPSANSHGGAGMFHRAQVCMGTQLRITLAGLTDEKAQEASSAAFAEARRLDRLLSHYVADSDICRIANSGPAGVQVAVETIEILGLGREFAQQTTGAFDPCLGAAIELWKDAVQKQVWPSRETLEATQTICGVDHLAIDTSNGSAALNREGTRIDLGGIAKGYALDRMAMCLRQHGATRALMNFGGQILALDPPVGQPGWRVEIASPGDRETPLMILGLANASIATSGNTEQCRRIGAREIGHIVDPRTLLPAAGNRTVTTIANRGVQADAWATAAYVLDRNALALAEQNGVGVLITSELGEPETNAAFDRMLSTSGGRIAAARR